MVPVKINQNNRVIWLSHFSTGFDGLFEELLAGLLAELLAFSFSCPALVCDALLGFIVLGIKI